MAALTGGLEVPSARFRVRQYIPALREHGIAMDELIAPFGAYPPVRRWLRPLWGAAALASDVPLVVKSWRSDVVFLQRSLISNFVTLEQLTRKPRILDVDDAIYLHGPEATSRRLAQLSDTVVCGNAFLANWFSKWNTRVVIIPTAVDTELYRPKHLEASDGTIVIGWIGTSGNFPYLSSVEGALAAVFAANRKARLRVVSDRVPSLPSLPAAQVEYIPWTATNEVSDIQGMDIGIMPLIDTPWARGKCSFKMLQYMACGLPVVVSPVGMNAEVLSLGECGLEASGETEWRDSLLSLIDNPNLRRRFGNTGQRVAEAHFSIKTVAPLLARCLLGTLDAQ